MVVSTPIRLPLRRVLVPIDLSDTARGALLVGLSWASALRGGPRENREHADVEITALYVRKDSPEAGGSSQPQALERELDQMRKQSGTWRRYRFMHRRSSAPMRRRESSTTFVKNPRHGRHGHSGTWTGSSRPAWVSRGVGDQGNRRAGAARATSSLERAGAHVVGKQTARVTDAGVYGRTSPPH